MIKTISALILMLGICFSCSKAPSKLLILSDKSELAGAAEIYTALHPDIQITLRHVPYISASVLSEHAADIVIGDDINSEAILTMLAPADISTPVYPVLASAGKHGKQEALIPLAFNLPLIVGRREVMKELPDPVIIRQADIRTLEEKFVRRDRYGRLSNLGFSPSWNPASYLDLLILEYRISELIFEDMHGFDELFVRVRDELSDWISSSAGSPDADFEFTRRYYYLPGDVLIANKRTLFTRMSFADWIAIPGTAAENLAIRYFAGDRVIPVQSVTWGGIGKNSPAKRQAAEFLQWLLTPDVQTQLMDRWEKDGLTVFGFLNGLSSIPQVNQTAVVERFPAIRGMLPENHFLFAMPILPDRWSRIRNEVIVPWFNSALYTENAAKLSEYYDKWDLHSLEERY
ncbi:MAG: hypothetical protein B0D92_04560 [Spirochaeta sp. LUC14_002_19_P3]|nr:MAG: hypothetical protein B0D92_04560 [Spirochaeta sp. LUC14_002_19_P3]